MVYGTPVFVAADASEAAMEAARLEIEQGLDAIHARAYAIVDRTPAPPPA